MDKLPKGRAAVGAKQVLKALQAGTAQRVYAAADADGFVNRKVLAMCKEKNVPVMDVPDMKQIGVACGIDVGAACCALLRE